MTPAKRFLKGLANAAATAYVLPVVALYWLSARFSSANAAFPGFSQLFSLLPGVTGIYLRRAFYRLVLPHCGPDVCVCFGTVFSHPTATLGERVYVGIGCMLGDVTLENDVLLGSHVSIINGRRQHGVQRLDVPIREQPGEYPRVVVGEDCWIGDRAIVTANVGRHAVVGAGAVVTKAVPEFAIVAGNPARVIGSRLEMAATTRNPSSAPAGVVVAGTPPVMIGPASSLSGTTAD
jgi:acetyltransferase-like isoleucine patch superfamily enzyme